MKISDLISQSSQILASLGINSARLDSIILLCQATSFTKEEIIFNPDLIISKQQQEIFFSLVEMRKKRMPISQIIGKREFYGLDFFVSDKVLDPRSDSELLVEETIKIIEQNFHRHFLDNSFDKKINFLELCVGSGCLTIAILKSLTNSKKLNNKALNIIADVVDIDQNALEICRKNIHHHQLEKQISVIKSDLFSELGGEKKYQLIISNPPYIESAEIENLQPEVRIYEPRIALDGGKDGLFFYRKIADKVADFLTENGVIIIEIGYGQKDKIIDIFQQKNFKNMAVKQDLSSIDRVLIFSKNQNS